MNAHERSKPVKGEIICQKKAKGGWEDVERISQQTLKQGEGFKITLSCEALRKLLVKVKSLEDFFEQNGIPGESTDVPEKDEYAMKAATHQLMKSVVDEHGVEVLLAALKQIQRTKDPKKVFEQLERLNIDDLQRINTFANLATLKRAVDIWKANEDNAQEEFWQTTFTDMSFVLSQLFSASVYFMKGKAYIGGQTIDGSHGKEADILMKTKKTGNVQIIELKTPTTKLQNAGTRMDIYGPSSALTAAVTQVMHYKSTLLDSKSGLKAKFEAIEPHCVVVAGHTKQFKADQVKLNSFELYRTNLRNCSVVTFDELFDKTEYLIKLIEGEAVEEDRF